MKIKKIDNKQWIEIWGDLNRLEGRQLEDEILLQVGRGEKYFVIDLKAVGHISIFGMTNLINLKLKSKELGFKIHLKDPSEKVHKLLKIYLEQVPER